MPLIEIDALPQPADVDVARETSEPSPAPGNVFVPVQPAELLVPDIVEDGEVVWRRVTGRRPNGDSR